MPVGNLTPQQGLADALEWQRSMNASRWIPQTPEVYRIASEKSRVYLFNVGPWARTRELGSAGTWIIPACPEDKEYAGPVVIEGVVEEPYPITAAECKVITTEGHVLAEQILGVGPHIPHSSSFIPFGCFMDTSPVPSKEKLARARLALNEKFLELVREASDARADGRDKQREVVMPAFHFVAARRLKKSVAECPWLEDAESPAARANCPGCGGVYEIGIVRHACGWIFDHDKWTSNQGSGKAK